MGGSQKFKYFFNSTLLDHVRKMTVGQYIENKLLYLSDSLKFYDEDTYTIIYRLYVKFWHLINFAFSIILSFMQIVSLL